MVSTVTPLSLCFLVGLLATAVYFDFRYHRIPNALTLGGTLAGLVFVVQTDPSWTAFSVSLGGAVLGLVLFLPLYALGKMGAGDAKMLAMVGVFVGPVGVIWASLWSLIAGGALAFFWLAGAWGLRQMAYRTLGTITAAGSGRATRHGSDGDDGTGQTVGSDPEGPSALKSKMPYAAAIAVGAVVAARMQLVT